VIKPNPSGVFLNQCLKIAKALGVDEHKKMTRAWCDGQLDIKLIRDSGILIVSEISHTPPDGRIELAIGVMFGSKFSRVRSQDLKRLGPIARDAAKSIEEASV
jgi:hypothetical protein